MNINAEKKEYNKNIFPIDRFDIDRFDIVHTPRDGDCAIHTLLEGLKKYYKDKKIISIINSLISNDIHITNLSYQLDKKNIISYSKDNIIAFRTALYNYYTTNKSVNKRSMYYPSSDELDKMKESSYYLQDKDFYHICKIFNICIYLRTHITIDRNPESKWIRLNPNNTNNCIYIIHIDQIHWELLKLKERPSVNKSRRSAKQSSRQSSRRSAKQSSSQSAKQSAKQSSRQSTKQSDNTHKVPKNDSTPVYNIAMGVFFFIILVGVSY